MIKTELTLASGTPVLGHQGSRAPSIHDSNANGLGEHLGMIHLMHLMHHDQQQ